MFIDSLGASEAAREFDLTPRTSWYIDQVGTRLRALDVFDRKTIRSADLAKIKLSLDQEGNSVHLRRDDEEGRAEAWFDLSLDGNLTRFILDFPNNELQKREFRWSRNPRNELYLQSASCIREINSRGRNVTLYEDLKVTSFEPKSRFPIDKFNLKSMNLQGVTVTDNVSRRNYRIGEIPRIKVSDSFDELIDAMKSSGFAAPDHR